MWPTPLPSGMVLPQTKFLHYPVPRQSQRMIQYTLQTPVALAQQLLFLITIWPLTLLSLLVALGPFCFLDRYQEIWSIAGLSNILGHRFRIDVTTFHLLLGVDPWVVMMQGCWSSQAFLTYWRCCKELLPLFIAFNLDSHATILSIMSHFRSHLLGQ